MVLHADFPPNATGFLKRQGTHQPEISRENEVPLFIQRQARMSCDFSCPLEVEADRVGLDTRFQPEVEFQTPAVAVEDQVDSRIDLKVAHSGIRRNIQPPLLRIPAAQVVTPAWKPVFTVDPGPRLAIDQPHPQSRDRPHLRGRPGASREFAGLKLKDQLAVEHQVAVARPSGKEANLILGLAPVRFEAEGQLAKGPTNLGLPDDLRHIRQTLGSSSGGGPADPGEGPRALLLRLELTGRKRSRAAACSDQDSPPKGRFCE